MSSKIKKGQPNTCISIRKILGQKVVSQISLEAIVRSVVINKCMGVAAILVVWPGPYKQICISHHKQSPNEIWVKLAEWF